MIKLIGLIRNPLVIALVAVIALLGLQSYRLNSCQAKVAEHKAVSKTLKKNLADKETEHKQRVKEIKRNAEIKIKYLPADDGVCFDDKWLRSIRQAPTKR